MFKLDNSNLKTWNGTPIENGQLEILYERMNEMVHRIKRDRSELDMVFEVMLKLGVPLSFPVEKIDVNGKRATLWARTVFCWCASSRTFSRMIWS